MCAQCLGYSKNLINGALTITTVGAAVFELGGYPDLEVIPLIGGPGFQFCLGHHFHV